MIVFAEATAALKARGYTDANVEEKLSQDVLLDALSRRVRRTFADRNYAARLAHRRSNWLQIDPSEAMERLCAFLESLRS